MNFLIELILAFFLDLLIGDPYGFPHPVIYMGRLIRKLESFGRKRYGDKNLKIYGGFIVISVCIITFIIPFFILKLLQPYNILYHIANIIMLWTTLAAKSLHVEGKKVYYSLKNNDIQDARIKLSYIVGRDTKNLNEKEIIRADIETISENTSDGIIAPLFFAMIFGAPLAMMYKGINTMDSTLGYKNEKYAHIGFIPAKSDDIFNLIPARITGVLIGCCSFFVGGNIFKSLKIMIRDRKNHKSPNCAYPEAACAGALGVLLGGDNIYFGEIVRKPTIGDKTKELEKEDINKAIILMYASEITLLMIYCIFILVIQHKF